MTFLAPWVLLGAAAAAIPLALHFFYRARYRPTPWAAMKFLRLSIEQTSRRLKFRELILLVLRVLVLVLLAVALARPASSALTGTGGGESVDAVFLIDTSYSMAARDGGVTRLERAKLAAQKVLDQLPPSSTVRVITFAARANVLGPRSPGNFDQARLILQSIGPTDLATDYLPAFAEAAAALDRGTSPNKEVYLFSDLQALGWEQQPDAVRAACEGLHRRAGLYLVRCGRRSPRNAALVDLVPDGGVPHTGARALFSALVRNFGTEEVRDLTVTLEVAGRPFEKDSQPIPVLGPGETRAVPLTAKLDQAGPVVLTAGLQADDLAADNRLDRVVQVYERVRVLVVDGNAQAREPDEASGYYLAHALRPVPEPDWPTYHIQPSVVRPSQASAALLADKQACVLLNAALHPGGEPIPGAFLERLERFAREGGGVVIAAGPNVNPAAYNARLGGLLPAPLRDVLRAPAGEPLHPDPASAERTSFLAGFRTDPLDQIGQAEVYQALRVQPREAENGTAADARVLMRYADGNPMVLSRRVGQGEVIFLTTGLGAEWTNWPRFPNTTYVPFVHLTLTHLLQRAAAGANRVAGEALSWAPPDNLQEYVLVRPGGEQVRLGKPAGRSADERLALTFADTARAGVYQILPAEKGSGARFAVVPDLRESQNLDGFSDGQIDALLGFRPVHLDAEADLSEVAGNERLRREWTVWVLLALFAFLAGEAAWAWFCGRPV